MSSQIFEAAYTSFEELAAEDPQLKAALDEYGKIRALQAEAERMRDDIDTANDVAREVLVAVPPFNAIGKATGYPTPTMEDMAEKLYLAENAVSPFYDLIRTLYDRAGGDMQGYVRDSVFSTDTYKKSVTERARDRREQMERAMPMLRNWHQSVIGVARVLEAELERVSRAQADSGFQFPKITITINE